jgi:hypothetical protein
LLLDPIAEACENSELERRADRERTPSFVRYPSSLEDDGEGEPSWERERRDGSFDGRCGKLWGTWRSASSRQG